MEKKEATANGVSGANVVTAPAAPVEPARRLLEAVCGQQSHEDWCNIRQLVRCMTRGQKIRDVDGKVQIDPPSAQIRDQKPVMTADDAALTIALKAKGDGVAPLEAARELVCEAKSRRLLAKEAAQADNQDATPEAAKEK
jgi:hypothetical protein